jgi:hypothetical protein
MTNAVQSHGASGSESRGHVWKRGGFMLVFIICFGLGQAALYIVAIGQFLWLAITQRHNELLASFGGSLSQWLAAAGRYLSCQSDEKPFPWSPWPSA